MVTKGVASVRSPVCNLQQFSNKVDHISFTDAVVSEFRKEYGINEDVGICPSGFSFLQMISHITSVDRGGGGIGRSPIN